MISLSDCFTKFITKQTSWKIVLSQRWPLLVGEMSNHMRLHKINADNSLVIAVYEARWMQELFYLTDELIRTINQELKGAYVSKLHFILARAPRTLRNCKERIPPQEHTAKKHPPQLSAQTLKQLALITDPGLRAAFAQLITLSL